MNGALKLFLLIALLAGAARLSSAQPAINTASLPLWFEANPASTGDGSAFVARGRNSEFFISASGASFALRKADGTLAKVQMQLIGANPQAAVQPENQISGKVSYLLGNQPSQWQSGLTTFSRVEVTDVYPGVNVVYYGNQRELEYDFNLAAGVDPQTIALRFNGAEEMSVNHDGELVVKVDGGTVYQHRPEVYQLENGLRHEVTVAYKILDSHTVTFAVGDYNHSLPLVIDPILGYSRYFGGNSGEQATAIALDGAGNIYIAGSTLSSVFSNAVPNGVFTHFSGGTLTGDAFVAKFDPNGTNLLFLTYLGGKGDDGATAVAVDSDGNVLVAGFTDSTDFPTNGFIAGLTNKISGQPIPRGGGAYPTDAFLAKLNSTGTSLLYSGYLGGNQTDGATSMAVDSDNGNVIVAGYTYSTNFPCTKLTAFQPHLNCTNSFYYNYNSFISVVSFTTSSLLYSTFYGGTNEDVIRGVAFTNGMLFVAGSTDSTNIYGFNSTVNFISSTNYIGTNHYVVTNLFIPSLMNGPLATNSQLYASFWDAFVAGFSIPNSTDPAAFSGFTNRYSMYLGGVLNDYAYSLAVDVNNSAYVVGSSSCKNFQYIVPNMTAVTNLSFLSTNQFTFGLSTNAFLTQVTWNGSKANIGYSVEFGGFGIDQALAVALDLQGNIYVVGSATSTNYPVTVGNVGLLIRTNSGGNDAVVTYFNTNSALPLFSAYWGGKKDDYANGVAVDSSSNVYVIGRTYSTNFPLNSTTYNHLSSSNDLFLSKILAAGWLTPALQTARFSTNDYVLYWPPLPNGGLTGLHLETSTNLGSPVWLTLSNVSTFAPPYSFIFTNYNPANGTNAVTNATVTSISNGQSAFGFTTTNPAQFFRLHQY